MDPINPWLDPAEVRRLAERLMKPNREPAVPAPDAGFDDALSATPAIPSPNRLRRRLSAKSFH